MRLFVALKLSDAVREAVAALQARLKASGGGVAAARGAAEVLWAEPANFHLTVKFLGDLPDALLPDVEAACAGVAAGSPFFDFAVRGAGAFPKRGGPLKTLWAGVDSGVDGAGAAAWKTLVRRAEPFFVPFGVAREGGLAPHVTLGRVKSATPEQDAALRAALAAEAKTDCGAQTAARIALVQSTLDPGGAVYTVLRDFELTG